MMQLDRMTLGRMAKEMGFVRDTFEKVCRLIDTLKFMEEDLDSFVYEYTNSGGVRDNLKIKFILEVVQKLVAMMLYSSVL